MNRLITDDCIEIKTQVTGNIDHEKSYPMRCESCVHEFDRGETRYTWRLKCTQTDQYLSGMFWTVHCRACLITHKQRWIQALEQLQV